MKHNPHRDNIVIAFYEGNTYGQIAKLYGVSRSSVAGIINRHRIDAPLAAKVNHTRQYGDFPSICAAARSEGVDDTSYRKREGIYSARQEMKVKAFSSSAASVFRALPPPPET